MPISQDRMIALIAAAQDFEQAFEVIISSIQLNTRRALHGQLTLEELCRNLQSDRPETLLLDPMKSAATLAKESHHFKITKRRNQREANRQRKKREEHGIVPKTYAPFQHHSKTNASPFLNPQVSSEIDQIILEQKLHGIKPRPKPVIDLAHDEDDPENAFDGGLGITSEDAGEE